MSHAADAVITKLVRLGYAVDLLQRWTINTCELTMSASVAGCATRMVRVHDEGEEALERAALELYASCGGDPATIDG